MACFRLQEAPIEVTCEFLASSVGLAFFDFFGRERSVIFSGLDLCESLQG